MTASSLDLLVVTNANQELLADCPVHAIGYAFTATTDDVYGDDDEDDAREGQDQHPTLITLLMRVVLLELDLLTGHLTHLPSVRSARSVRSGRPDEQPRG